LLQKLMLNTSSNKLINLKELVKLIKPKKLVIKPFYSKLFCILHEKKGWLAFFVRDIKQMQGQFSHWMEEQLIYSSGQRTFNEQFIQGKEGEKILKKHTTHIISSIDDVWWIYIDSWHLYVCVCVCIYIYILSVVTLEL